MREKIKIGKTNMLQNSIFTNHTNDCSFNHLLTYYLIHNSII